MSRKDIQRIRYRQKFFARFINSKGSDDMNFTKKSSGTSPSSSILASLRVSKNKHTFLSSDAGRFSQTLTLQSTDRAPGIYRCIMRISTQRFLQTAHLGSVRPIWMVGGIVRRSISSFFWFCKRIYAIRSSAGEIF